MPKTRFGYAKCPCCNTKPDVYYDMIQFWMYATHRDKNGAVCRYSNTIVTGSLVRTE